MRLAVAVFCAVLLPACASSSDEALPLAPTGPVVGVPDSLAARIVPNALTAAFGRLDASSYEARLVVETLDDAGQRTGRFERRSVHRPGESDQVLETRASGTLADTSGLDLARPSDPLPSVLADMPAYLAPSTRDQYAFRTGPARRAVRALDIRHTAETDQAVERVTAAIDTTTGDILRVSVFRTSTSAIYDEATRAEVRLRQIGATVIPQAIETTSTVSTPLSGTTTYRVSWQIGPPPDRP